MAQLYQTQQLYCYITVNGLLLCGSQISNPAENAGRAKHMQRLTVPLCDRKEGGQAFKRHKCSGTGELHRETDLNTSEEMSENLQWAGSACISVIVKTHNINCMCTHKCVTNDFKHINIWTALMLFLPHEDIWELSSNSLAVDQMTKTELRVVRVEKAWNLKKWSSGDSCARHHKTVSCMLVVFFTSLSFQNETDKCL